MSQPSFLASGTTPLRSDTKSRVWAKILGTQQNRTGAAAVNDPKITDTLWRTKYKLARSMAGNGCPIGSGSGGGGGGGGTGDPDVDAFLTCTGITDSATSTALLNLVVSLKNNGLWTAMDAIYPFVGGNATAHSCNLRNTAAYSITWHGGVTHDSNGITGDGSTGYGDTGFLSSAGGVNFVKDTGALGVYCRSDMITTDNLMGAFNTPEGSAIGWDSGLLSGFMVGFSNATPTALPTITTKGYFIGSRLDAATQNLYVPDGSSAAENSGSSATITLNFYVLAANVANAPNAATDANLAFAFIGAGIDDSHVATLKIIINTFQAAMGRDV